MEEIQIIYKGQNLSNKLMNILNQTPVNIDIDQRLREDFIINPSSEKKCYIDINTLDQQQSSYNSDENDDMYLEIFKDDEFIMSDPLPSSLYSSPQTFEKENERQQIQNPISSILIDVNNTENDNIIHKPSTDDEINYSEPSQQSILYPEEEESLSMIKPYSLQLQSQLNNVLQENSNENSHPVRLSELNIGDEIKLDPKNNNSSIISIIPSSLSRKSNVYNKRLQTINSKKRKPSLVFTGRKSAIKHRKTNGGNKRRNKSKTQKRKK